MLDSVQAGTTASEDEYFPVEENPATPNIVKVHESNSNKKQVTPKLNEGTPSTLLTPVTPTVTQGSDVTVLSPKKPFPTSPVSDADDCEVKATMESNAGKSTVVTKPSITSESASVGNADSVQDIVESELFFLPFTFFLGCSFCSLPSF